MSGFGQLGHNLSSEQQSLLQKSSFSLRPLGSAGHLSIWRVLLRSWQPVAAFLFSVLILTPSDFRSSSESLDTALYAVGVVALLAYPAVAFVVLVSGILATRVHSKVRWSAALYWVWWPAATLATCCLAVALGTALGNHIWYDNFRPFVQVERLQAYQHVDPLVASGVRLQDAGLVLFNRTAAVDRLATGCHKNGAVYCVAPIRGHGAAGAGHHDLFMAGVDCCSCPGEFRCGDWSAPASLGGIRVVDPHDNEFFRMAAQDWSAAHGLKVQRPLFFHWVTDPIATHQDMRRKGWRLLCLGLLVGPCLLLAVAAALNGLLGLLVDTGYAVPIDPPKKLSRPSWPGRRSDSEEGDDGEVDATPPDPKYVCL